MEPGHTHAVLTPEEVEAMLAKAEKDIDVTFMFEAAKLLRDLRRKRIEEGKPLKLASASIDENGGVSFRIA